MTYLEFQAARAAMLKQASMDEAMARKFYAQQALPDAGVGAAIGAGVGGLAGLVGPRKNRLKRALILAAGGGLAGGLGAGITNYATKGSVSLNDNLADMYQNAKDRYRDYQVSKGTRNPNEGKGKKE